MLHGFAQDLSAKISKLQDINDDIKIEEMSYGFEIILSTFLSVGAVLIIATLFNMFYDCIVFLCVFMPLRMYTGGYHAQTHLTCFLILLLDMFVGVIFMSLLQNSIFVFSVIVMVLSVIIVTLYAPVVHENYPLSKQQVQNSRKKGFLVLFAVVIGIILFLTTKNYGISFCASFGLASVSVSILVAKIQEKGGKKSEV